MLEEKEKRSFISWIKEHKNQLIIAGVSITAIILAALSIKNKEALLKLWADLKEDIAYNVDKAPIGRTANLERIETMKEKETFHNMPAFTAIDSETIEKTPFEVKKHIRNLAQNYHPSEEKVAKAVENGIELLPNQTWVKEYTKRFIAS